MAFGPERLVVRNEPVQGKANQVRLGQFDPDQFPAIPDDDPARHFMDAVLLRFLKTQASRFMNRRIAEKDYILWGVIEEDEPVGFAALSRDDQDRAFCTYTIVLHPSVRHRGLGGLATAGIVQTGLEDSALHNASESFSHYMAGIGTAIHPENLISQKMCEGAGFELVEGEYELISGVNFLSYLCVRVPQDPLATAFPA